MATNSDTDASSFIKFTESMIIERNKAVADYCAQLITEKDREIAALRSQLSMHAACECSSASAKINELSDALAERRNINAEHRINNVMLLSQINDLKRQLDNEKKTVIKLNAQVYSLESNNASLRADYEQQIQSLENAKQILERDCNEYEKKYQKEQQFAAKVGARNLINEVKIRKQTEKYNKDIHDYVNEIGKQKDEIIILKAELHNATGMLKHREQSCQEYAAMQIKLNTKLEQAKNKIAELSAGIDIVHDEEKQELYEKIISLEYNCQTLADANTAFINSFTLPELEPLINIRSKIKNSYEFENNLKKQYDNYVAMVNKISAYIKNYRDKVEANRIATDINVRIAELEQNVKASKEDYKRLEAEAGILVKNWTAERYMLTEQNAEYFEKIKQYEEILRKKNVKLARKSSSIKYLANLKAKHLTKLAILETEVENTQQVLKYCHAHIALKTRTVAQLTHVILSIHPIIETIKHNMIEFACATNINIDSSKQFDVFVEFDEFIKSITSRHISPELVAAPAFEC